MPDPLAIQISSSVSLALQGQHQGMGLAIRNPQQFYNLVKGTDTNNFTSAPDNQYGDMLTFIRHVQLESKSYSGRINEATSRAPNRSSYPNTGLANQMKMVAQMIAGGLKTRVYVVSMGGFDTHASQVVTSDTTLGRHADLLRQLSDAILAFQSDLKYYGIEDKVVGMTFSEFGRRPYSNGSNGTDHGTAAPMFVFGKNIQGGLFGKNVDLTNFERNNLKMQHDFRQVYASMMSQWFGVGETDMNGIMKRDFPQIPILKPATALSMEVVRSHVVSRGSNFTYEIEALSENDLGTEADVTVFDTVGNTDEATTIRAGLDGKVSYTVSVPSDKPAGRYPVQFRLPNGYFTVVEVIVE
jgi:uncharacterized protein (DUF1501 family)